MQVAMVSSHPKYSGRDGHRCSAKSCFIYLATYIVQQRCRIRELVGVHLKERDDMTGIWIKCDSLQPSNLGTHGNVHKHIFSPDIVASTDCWQIRVLTLLSLDS